MQTKLLQAFVAQRPALLLNWDHFLRLERVNSPLANPDTLVHLLDHTLDEFFRRLSLWLPRPQPGQAAALYCLCGSNPLLAYFSAGLQAVREALIYAQLSIPLLSAHERDESLVQVNEVFASLARREIESFCGVCLLRSVVPLPPRQPLAAPPVRRRPIHAISHDRSTAPHLQSVEIRG